MNKDQNITITTASTREHLEQILALLKDNHRSYVSPEQATLNGFVTIEYTFDELQLLNKIRPQVIAISGNRVVAYALILTKESENLIEELESMFQVLNNILYHGQLLADLNYYVMGQICIASSFRGRGIFDQLYDYHRELLAKEYDLTVTEIATRNQRSRSAHKRVGFEEVAFHKDSLDEWVVLVRNNR